MSAEKLIGTIDEFISVIKASGINKIAFAETSEKRAVAGEPGQLKVDSYRKLELIAYKKPSLYKCIIVDPDFESVYNMLTGQGFEIIRSNRNIT